MFSPKKISENHLKVSPIHEIFIQEFGNSKGYPVCVVHGGPGSGSSPYMPEMFDQDCWRIIVCDQRGSGKSTPFGSIEDNTTEKLVKDLELVREWLGIKKWMMLGGSWGSTLALKYAQAHPQNITSLILRGLFQGTMEEIDWFIEKRDEKEKYRKEFWEEIPQGHKALDFYYEKIIQKNSKTHTKRWAFLEASSLGENVDQTQVNEFFDEQKAYSLSRIEVHYFKNNCFLKDNEISNNMSNLTHLPISLIHGSLDKICSVNFALKFSRRFPWVRSFILEGAGHAGLDPQILKAVLEEIDHHKRYQ